MSLSKKNIKKVNENKVAEFLSKVIQKLTYFFDNEIMDTFDITFEYNGKQYRLTLSEIVKVNSKDLVSRLKSIIDKNFN